MGSAKNARCRGLNDDEDEVEQDGDGGEQDGLERGLARVGLGLGVVRYDQGEDRERGDDHEKGAGAFEIVLLLPVAESAHEQRRAHHAVQHDHQGGEHGVAGECRIVLAMQHDGGEKRDLNDDHRKGEHKRAVRLAELRRDGVGMAHHCEGAPHHGTEQPDEQQDGERIVGQVREQHVLEGIGETGGDDPCDRRRLGGEERARALLLQGGRLGGFALVHKAPVCPGPLEHDPEKGNRFSDMIMLKPLPLTMLRGPG